MNNHPGAADDSRNGFSPPVLDPVAIYGREDIWGLGPDRYQMNVLRDILGVLPPDAGSVLDVGCGDGYITNALPGNLRVVGLDVGEASLKHIRREKLVGQITSLPCGDGAFDLVMANDTIEHIPDSQFPRALAELQRASGRYLLITVPFMENMQAGRMICAHCGMGSHVNHHQRAFGVAELVPLFGPGWHVLAIVFSGTPMTPVERIFREIRARSGAAAGWENSICPRCGHIGSIPVVDEDALAAVRELAGALPFPSLSWQVDRSECIVVYERRGDDAGSSRFDPPLWSLTAEGRDSTRTFPAGFQQTKAALGVVSPGFAPGDEDRIVLEYLLDGVRYRLPEPRKIGEATYEIPLWFVPPYVNLISATGLNRLDFVADTLLLATDAMKRWQDRHADSAKGKHAVGSEQLLLLWEMQVKLRAMIARQETEITSLKDRLGMLTEPRSTRTS